MRFDIFRTRAFSSSGHRCVKDRRAAIDIIPPDQLVRSRPVRFPTGADEIIDAEFEEVPDFEAVDPSRSKPERPGAPDSGCRKQPSRPYFRGGSPAPSVPATNGRGFAALVAGLSVLSFWFAGGHSMISVLSPDGGAASQLDIAGLRSAIVEKPDGPVIVVGGRIENRGSATQEVPPVRVVLFGDGAPPRATLVTPNRRVLAAGQKLPFTAELDRDGGLSDATVAVSFERTGSIR